MPRKPPRGRRAVGARRSLAILAPIPLERLDHRRMGRRDSEASPISRLAKEWPATHAGEEPHRGPEFPASSRVGRRQQAANAAALTEQHPKSDTSKTPSVTATPNCRGTTEVDGSRHLAQNWSAPCVMSNRGYEA
jgi:hypothetical protein